MSDSPYGAAAQSRGGVSGILPFNWLDDDDVKSAMWKLRVTRRFGARGDPWEQMCVKFLLAHGVTQSVIDEIR